MYGFWRIGKSMLSHPYSWNGGMNRGAANSFPATVNAGVGEGVGMTDSMVQERTREGGVVDDKQTQKAPSPLFIYTSHES